MPTRYTRLIIMALALAVLPDMALAAPRSPFAVNIIACDGTGIGGTVQFVERPWEQIRWMWLGNTFYMGAVNQDGTTNGTRNTLMIEDYITGPRVMLDGKLVTQGEVRQVFLDISHNIIKSCWKRIGKSVSEFERSMR